MRKRQSEFTDPASLTAESSRRPLANLQLKGKHLCENDRGKRGESKNESDNCGSGSRGVCLPTGARSVRRNAKDPEVKLEFEVASIKRSALPGRGASRLGRQGGPGSGRSGRVSYAFSTIRDLIVDAYGVKPSQVSGGPKWLDSSNDLTSWPSCPRVPRRNRSRSCCKLSLRSVSSSRCIAKRKSCRSTRWWWALKVPS